VEYNALGGCDWQMEDLAKMPGDGLAFTVVVCGEDDFAGVGNGGAEFRDLGVLGRHNRELNREFAVDVDGFQTIRNLSDMPETGETRILIFAEVGLDFLALGGGFNDDERATGGTGAGDRGGAGASSGAGARSGAGAWSCRRLDFELGRHCVCCNFIYKIRIQFYTRLDFFDLRLFFLRRCCVLRIRRLDCFRREPPWGGRNNDFINVSSIL